jgi:RsiW-degrading membrane proteinase PrsW (M82 family)
VLLARGLLAIAMILLGAVILARMLQAASSGPAILPGVVLGGAMIALGLHRIWLIARVRRMM